MKEIEKIPQQSELYEEVLPFLKNFYYALQSFGLYPNTHPKITQSIDLLTKSYNQLLKGKDKIVLSTIKTDLLVNGKSMEKGLQQVKDFAYFLYENRISSVTFTGQMDRTSLRKLMLIIANNPKDSGSQLIEKIAEAGIPNMQVKPIRYKALLSQQIQSSGFLKGEGGAAETSHLVEYLQKRRQTMSEKLAILVGGGPAPGINGVIEAATTEAIRQGKEVIGILEGFKWLSKGDTTHMRRLNPEDVHGIEQKGGSILRTSRDNPLNNSEKMANCLAVLKALEVGYLITVGGDDTSHSARALAQKAEGTISVAHVPKTIDNDLPLPLGVPTFGFETARELGARLVFSLLEDARTSSRWYIVVSMGRSAGFLGLSIALAAGAPLALIPEEFSVNTPLQRIIDIIEGSILKRLSLGKDFGVCVISEGMAQRLRSSDFHFIETVGRDEHGNIKLADVPLGAVVRQELEKSLSGRGINMKLIAKDIGFELRSCPPCAFDREYTRQLGVSAVRFLLEQKGTSAMITFHRGKAEPVPFDSLVVPTTGKTRVRLVDTSSDYFINALRLMERLQKDDLSDKAKLNAIADVSGMDEAALRKRFGYIAGV